MMVISYHSAGFGFFLFGTCYVDVAAMIGVVVDTENCLAGVGMSPNRL